MARKKLKKSRGSTRPGRGDDKVESKTSDDLEETTEEEIEGEVDAVDSEDELVDEKVAEGGSSEDEDSPIPSKVKPEELPRGVSQPSTSWFDVIRGDPLPSFLRHIHPKSVFRRSLEPIRTLGLGLLSLYLAVILAITGVLLMVYYVPSAAGAYGSIQDLHAVVPFGGLVRNVHRWAGHAMVLLVALHLLRTALTGSYKKGRRGVWTAGVWLLVLTLAFAFTGYLLPWDQLSYWAVSIGGHLAGNVPFFGDALSRALLGGDEVSGATLVRFYALHVGILPFITTIFIALHLYRLRRAGGLARPQEGTFTKVSAWPHLYQRELTLLALTVVVLIIVGVLFDAPLGSEPDMEHPDNPSKAPWYFLGLQELVSYSSLIGGVVIPLLSVIVLYIVPIVDRTNEGVGSWFAPRNGFLAFVIGALVSALAFPAALAFYLRAGTESPPGANPATFLLASMLLVALGVWLRWRSPRLTVLGIVGAGTVGVAMLTVVGFALRGPSWALMIPWGAP